MSWPRKRLSWSAISEYISCLCDYAISECKTHKHNIQERRTQRTVWIDKNCNPTKVLLSIHGQIIHYYYGIQNHTSHYWDKTSFLSLQHQHHSSHIIDYTDFGIQNAMALRRTRDVKGWWAFLNTKPCRISSLPDLCFRCTNDLLDQFDLFCALDGVNRFYEVRWASGSQSCEKTMQDLISD